MKRYLIGFISSVIVGVLCLWIGVSDYLAGWFACTAYFMANFWKFN